MSNRDTTIIICCAGEGTRLGIGTTKALLRINGKPLIIHQLEQLPQYDDIRIVVGFQAEKVINIVNEYRRDVMFAFNYNYQTTGPLESVRKAIIGARTYSLVFGGDTYIAPGDIAKIAGYDGSCVGYSKVHSKEPICIDVKDDVAYSFKKVEKNFEWSGLVKFRSALFKNEHYYVHEMLENLLPMRSFEICAVDIDTPEDYEHVASLARDSK